MRTPIWWKWTEALAVAINLPKLTDESTNSQLWNGVWGRHVAEDILAALWSGD